MRKAGRSGGPILSWWAMCALTSLLYVSRRQLPAPPWSQPGLVPGWWRKHGPLLATFGVGRELLFCSGCYLVALWTAVLVARQPRSWLVRVLRRARLPGVQLVVRTVVGLTAAGAAWTANVAGSASTAPQLDRGRIPVRPDAGLSSAPVLRLAGPTPPPSRWVGRSPAPTAGARATGNQPRPARAPATGILPVPEASHRRVRGQSPPPSASGRAGRLGPQPFLVDGQPGGTWRVRPGDNLWTIAADALTAAWGRPPDVHEVAPYWWRVVQINRPHLPNPSDPNLLFAGDRVALPPPPPSPSRSG